MLVEYRNRPPIGAGSGLPFTWLMDSSGATSPLTNHSTTTASGTNFANDSVRSSSAWVSGAESSAKLLINTEAPRLNLGTGDLWFGQMSMGIGETYNGDAMYRTNGIVETVATYSGHGRYTRLEDSYTASNPGNYTWQAWASGNRLTVGDVAVGETRVDITTSASDNDGRVAGVCVYSACDIASGGFGRMWGDLHDTAYLVNVGASYISPANASTLTYHSPSETGRITGGAAQAWTVNLAPQYNFKDTDNLSNDLSSSQTSAVGLSTETIMHLAHREAATSAGPTVTHQLGSPAHGTVVVADSCGLVGYEGVMVATAHFTPSKQQDIAVPVSAQEYGYCALNILVHTGESSRRTATAANRYTDSGEDCRGLAERMKTDCGILKGTRVADWAHGSTHYTKLVAGSSASDYRVYKETTGTVTSTTNCKRIVGDAVDVTGAWDGTANLNLTFMAEKVPTRIRVIPSLVSYDTQSASHRNPIVDYHVVISLADRPNDIERDSTNDATVRNSPQFDVNYTDMNMDGTPCTIWHGIFRIEPDRTATDLSDTKMVSAWNLKQATPFRPIANQGWARVPRLCGAVDAGGPHQRGGIAHIWDADAFGGDLYIGADLWDCTDISTSTGNDKNGHETFGFWGHGQVWPGTADPQVPPGRELVIFKYSAMTDPYYPGTTPSAQWPLRKWLDTKSSDFVDNPPAAMDASLHHVNHAATLTDWKGWEIHDWVFPQIELMSYLGVEDKSQPKTNHPTIHCGSLRFTDEGQMLMTAIHQDIITSSAQTPTMDIGWPFNPDVMHNQLPPGYYLGTDGEVHPIGTGTLNPESEDFVAEMGEAFTGFVEPEFTRADPESFSGQDTVFGYIPPWNKLKSGKARSLVLMWSENGLNDGRPIAGLNKFDVNWERVDGQWQATQTWTHKDNWWSGSRIAYWYAESGQRAIPIVYGAFPASRLSAVSLPRALPYIDYALNKHEGLPTLQPLLDLSAGPGGLSSGIGGVGELYIGAPEDAHTIMYNWTVRNRFFPTLVGFADFGPGSSPWQEWGWSGWSFPSGLYDPISYTHTDFFSESTTRAPWQSFGDPAPISPARFLNGPVGAISHFGPLHYGMSQQSHPFATDRIWKQVHAGVGYDIPIHKLKPGDVHVRARSGMKGSLDLELETPFHRTDTLHIQGQVDYIDPSSQGVVGLPGGSRTALGQYFLATNLWKDNESTLERELIRGPLASGTMIANELSRWWQDHPTEHFHASAMPLIDDSVDYNYLESNRYPLPLHSSIKEFSDVDALAQSEQLQASVEVFVPQTVAPVWDSGSIVSARGVGRFAEVFYLRHSGLANSLSNHRFTGLSSDPTSGFGSKIVQTNDGTLHRFSLELKSDDSLDLCIRHYMKPLHSDLFWNRHGTGIDEITITGASHYLSLASAADSEGKLHLIVGVENSSGEHGLHHVVATPEVERINPEPVSKWDWSSATKTEIASSLVSQPSCAIDSNDVMHLCFTNHVDQGSGDFTTRIIYYFTDLGEPVWTYPGSPSGRWQQVSKDSGDANSLADPRRVKVACEPRIHLRGDNTPIIVYGGTDPESASPRNRHAVYASIGRTQASSIGWTFDVDESCHVLGLPPYTNYTPDSAYTGLLSWDSAIDNNGRLNIVAIGNGIDSAEKRQVIELAVVETTSTVYSQYSTTTGCGRQVLIYHHTDAVGRQFNAQFNNITMGIDHENSVHCVLEAFTYLTDSDSGITGEVFRESNSDAGTAYPLNYPGQPSTEAQAYSEGSATNWALWEGMIGFGGMNSQLLELWWPSIEVSVGSETVLRSMNFRWLSVPSMSWDEQNGFQPVTTASTMAGTEMFPHNNPMLRQQRFHAYSTSLDLIWDTTYRAIYRTEHPASRMYHWEGGL